MLTSTDRQRNVHLFGRLKSEFSTGFMQSKFATSSHSQTVLTTWCNALTDPTMIRLDFKRLPGKTKGTRKKSNHQSVIPEKPCAQATSHYETPKPNWKKRNSLDSMRSLSAKQSNTVSELKSVISELESDVSEIKNALDISNCENKLSSLQDKIIQISNLSKASIQTLSCKNSEIRN